MIAALLFTLGAVGLARALHRDSHWAWGFLAFAGYAGAAVAVVLTHWHR